MENVTELRKRYNPLRIIPDDTYGRLLNDVRVSMDSFQSTQLIVFLDQAKDAMDALHQRAHQ